MKTLVKDFCYRGEHFSIVDDGKFIMTVNHKFIGADGRLTKQLTFADGLHTSNSIDEAIRATKEDLDIKHYINKGFTKAEAFAKVMNVPMEVAKMIFGAV